MCECGWSSGKWGAGCRSSAYAEWHWLTSCAVDDEHKYAMKLYLDSWVVAPLQRALEEIKRKRG